MSHSLSCALRHIFTDMQSWRWRWYKNIYSLTVGGGEEDAETRNLHVSRVPTPSLNTVYFYNSSIDSNSEQNKGLRTASRIYQASPSNMDGIRNVYNCTALSKNFYWLNLSGSTITLSASNRKGYQGYILGGWGWERWPVRRADNITAFMYRLSINSGSLNFMEPSGPFQVLYRDCLTCTFTFTFGKNMVNSSKEDEEKCGYWRQNWELKVLRLSDVTADIFALS